MVLITKRQLPNNSGYNGDCKHRITIKK